MKKFLIVATLVLVGCSMGRAQSGQVAPQEGSKVAAPQGWCMGCTDSQKVDLINRENRGKDVADHNQWPTAPKISSSAPRPYALFTTHFLVSNESEKKIRLIKWEATLTNRDTKETIQTFTLVSEKAIAPHKSVVLRKKLAVTMKTLMGPVVPAGQLGKDPSKPVEVDEQYKIIEIEYKDGSISRPR